MKLKPVKLAPALIAVGVILLTCLLRLLVAADTTTPSPHTGRAVERNLIEELERATYDWRARIALKFSNPVATNLGFVFMSDDSIVAVNNGSLGYRYGLYWPRQLYGRVYHELAAQGAKAVGFDILFRESRVDQGAIEVPNHQSPDLGAFLSGLYPDQPSTVVTNGSTLVESDDYFAWQLKRGGTAILAAEKHALPMDLLASNALAVADVTAERDADGVLRRARAFHNYHKWHSAFRQVEMKPEYGVDLSRARIEPGQIVLIRGMGDDQIVRGEDDDIKVPLDQDGNFDMAAFAGDTLPPGVPRKARAVTEKRVWHMGIELAARALDLNLNDANVDLPHGRITLRGANGVERIIPVDSKGYFYINWELAVTNANLTVEPIESLLELYQVRTGQRPGELTNRWANKLVVIGSSAAGNDLTDRGATPLESDTLLVSEHWNIANSILTDRFVWRSSVGTDLLVIVIMGIATALLTWQLRALTSLFAVVVLLAGYIVLGVIMYVQHRYWLPWVLPLSGALIQYVCLNTWRVVFEQAEQRRVKSIFSTVVSPKIMTELLKVEKLFLGGERREITVLFADVRGFTEFTDTNQEKAAAHVAAKKLSGDAAKAYFDEQARDTLATVNLYLGVVAETIIQHDATLDKFIGDCVMAFWGAPAGNPTHGLACVRAAIDAQRTVHELNQERAAENKRREQENITRSSAGLDPVPMLPVLLLGTGINTGTVTVGLMGSGTKSGGVRQGNYTVFGREVNLASRLEGLSGRGRIFISEATYEQLRRDDPALAATCLLQPPAKLKGIGTAGKVYEVPWQSAEATSLPHEASSDTSTDRFGDTDPNLRKT